MLHTVRSIACSVTNTHLLPKTLSRVVSGVRAAISSSVIKLEPAPSRIWLKATHNKVYHNVPKMMNPSSSWSPRIPTRFRRPALLDRKSARSRGLCARTVCEFILTIVSRPATTQHHTNSTTLVQNLGLDSTWWRRGGTAVQNVKAREEKK